MASRVKIVDKFDREIYLDLDGVSDFMKLEDKDNYCLLLLHFKNGREITPWIRISDYDKMHESWNN